MTLIACPKCKTEKAPSEFGRNAGRPNGLALYCRPCFKAYQQTRAAARPKRTPLSKIRRTACSKCHGVLAPDGTGCAPCRNARDRRARAKKPRLRRCIDCKERKPLKAFEKPTAACCSLCVLLKERKCAKCGICKLLHHFKGKGGEICDVCKPLELAKRRARTVEGQENKKRENRDKVIAQKEAKAAEEFRICKVCDERKPITKFAKEKRCLGGRRSTCGSCDYQLRKPHRKARAKTPAGRQKRRRREKEREMKKAQALPPWLSQEQRAACWQIYLERDRLSQETGVRHEVDHIIPISGNDAGVQVCGLHVPWNLQPIPAVINNDKAVIFLQIARILFEAEFLKII